jgi:rod shape-determining protein MreC
VIDRALLQASTPVQYAASQAAQAVSTVIEDYTFLIDVRKENDQLKAEVSRLRRRNHELEPYAAEILRLRKLIDLRDRTGGDVLSAWVIGREVSPFFRVMRIRLDRGEQDRVQPGLPVISPDGLVGQIRRSWGKYSDVLLTVDKTSAVDVVVDRTGAHGMLRGTGENNRYLCRMQYFVRSDDVKIGDRVVTSGFGQRFPASIVVGTVSRVIRKEFGLYQEVEVIPAIDFGRLEEALILVQKTRESDLDHGESP